MVNQQCRAIAVIAAICASALPAQSQESPVTSDHDWNIYEVTDRNTVVAIAEFDNGITLASRCANNVFDVLISGLPETRDTTRQLRVSVGENASYASSWLVGEIRSAAFSRIPARLARTLMSGGTLKIQIPAEHNRPATLYVMELDPSSTAVARTLSACNIAWQDSRYDDYGDESSNELTPGLEWYRRPQPEYPAPVKGMSPTRGFATVSCITGADGKLDQCLVESEQPTGYGLGKAVLDATRRSRVRSSDPARPIDGPRTIVFHANFMMQQ